MIISLLLTWINGGALGAEPPCAIVHLLPRLLVVHNDLVRRDEHIFILSHASPPHPKVVYASLRMSQTLHGLGTPQSSTCQDCSYLSPVPDRDNRKYTCRGWLVFQDRMSSHTNFLFKSFHHHTLDRRSQRGSEPAAVDPTQQSLVQRDLHALDL